MRKSQRPVLIMLIGTAIVLFSVLIMQPLEIRKFGSEIAVLFPKGIIALKERNLLFIIQALMLLIVIPVYVLTFVFSWKYSATNPKGKYDPDLIDNKLAEVVWWGLPLVLTALVSVLTWVKTHELDPYKPIVSDKKAITIQAVALQWKWLFIYPEEKIATINYVQFPAHTPVRFEVTADAPMNSLWIPALGGQIYAMPKMRTELHLIANEEGEFRGSSANLSGEGFAEMRFIAKASSDEDFKAWIESAKQSASELTLQEYNALAAPSTNNRERIFQLKEDNLFDQIIMKYMHPSKEVS